MNEAGVWFLILVGVGAVLILYLALCLLSFAFAGALHLFGKAAEHGFFGFAVYVVLWAVALPVMLMISIVLGLFIYIASLKDK